MFNTIVELVIDAVGTALFGGKKSGKRGAGSRKAKRAGGSSGPKQAGPTPTAFTPADLPSAQDDPVVYSISSLGIPRFSYAPHADGNPDPGEVVWTWVPFEEDRTQGKDRPVLVVAQENGVIIFAQLTSKDHDRDAAQEARAGRFWFDIGSGDWDNQGRPSEVRIDRLLCVHPSRVRREGGRLDDVRFTEVVRAIKEFHS